MPDRIIDHYERHARDWDADRNLRVNPWNDMPWHDRFIASLRRAASVLDLGCGSGSPVAKYIPAEGALPRPWFLLIANAYFAMPHNVSPIMNGW